MTCRKALGPTMWKLLFFENKQKKNKSCAQLLLGRAWIHRDQAPAQDGIQLCGLEACLSLSVNYKAFGKLEVGLHSPEWKGCQRDGAPKKAVLSHKHMTEERRKWLRCLRPWGSDGASSRRNQASEAETSPAVQWLRARCGLGVWGRLILVRELNLTYLRLKDPPWHSRYPRSRVLQLSKERT